MDLAAVASPLPWPTASPLPFCGRSIHKWEADAQVGGGSFGSLELGRRPLLTALPPSSSAGLPLLFLSMGDRCMTRWPSGG